MSSEFVGQTEKFAKVLNDLYDITGDEPVTIYVPAQLYHRLRVSTSMQFSNANYNIPIIDSGTELKFKDIITIKKDINGQIKRLEQEIHKSKIQLQELIDLKTKEQF